jgi:DNA-directed RNA polymerase beta subunit
MADFLDALSGAAPKPVTPPKPVTLRRFDDVAGQRQAIYDNALEGVRTRFPIQNDTHRIELVNADYDGDYNPTRADEKKALLEGGRLQRAIKGRIRLVDNKTNQVLDEQNAVLAHVPHLNSRGLFIHNGVPYSIRNQARLRPGVYVRRQQNGGVEAHVNVKPGTGRGFRVNLDPETGVFNLQVEQSKTRLYPLLKALGVKDEDLKQAWGEQLFKQNWREVSGHDQQDLRKVVQKLGRQAEREAPDHELPKALQTILDRARIDPEVSELTLGGQHDRPGLDALTKATQKILRVANNQEEGDNRDSQAFQSVHSAEDLIRERLERDQAGEMRKLLWGAAKSGKLDKLRSGILTPNVHALYRTGLSSAVEDINPFETYDQRQAITRLGEGGISSTQSVSRDARGVQPSYFGIIDGVRAPESSNIGLDMRVTDAALKGSDGQLYTTLRDPATGKLETLSARQMANHAIAFPGELAKGERKVRAMVGHKIQYIDRSKVKYELPDATHLFSRASNMVPLLEGVKSQRLLMGARMTTQALPLKDAEAPLVHPLDHEGKSFYQQMGSHAGAVHSEAPGRVVKVTPDGIDVLHEGGQQKHYELYNHYPLARKTMLHNTPVVQAGDVVQPGQLLAHSNFTDRNGHAAPGRNLRVAYLAGEGLTYDDSVAISESAAKKLSSEHQYKHSLDLGDEVHSTKTNDYRAIYGDRFSKAQYDKLDESGTVQVGQTINPGDPVMVAIGKRQGRAQGALTNGPKSLYTDISQVWDHPQPGVVTDVARTRSGVKVTVKSYEPMSVGSKLSGQYGNKGVVSKIIPDDQMPHDEDGRPMDVLMAPTGIITRVNPSSLVTTLLGKIAEKRGQPYNLKSFSTPEGLADFALNEAHKHGVKETETLRDPRNGRRIPNVFTGNQYILKLHHTAESKMSARDTGGYSADESPARGGPDGSKRIGLLDIHSLLSAGATEFLKDAKLVRGQRNDDFWRQLKTGQTPAQQGKSFANGHFLDLLRSAGVNIKDKPDGRQQLGFMTDADVDRLAQHEISKPDTFDFNTMKPVEGGLFDLGKTGGAEGTRFSKIVLPAKIPNPMAEEPITRILGLTGKKFEQILAGKEQINGKSGPQAIEDALKTINVDREIELAKQQVRTASRSNRDDAVRRLGYLQGLKTQGVKPEDLMISKMAVLPPKHRPIMRARGVDMIHDANYLYKDLMESAKNYQGAGEELGENGDEYLTMYNAAKAVAGLTDPVNPKTAEQGVRGMLRFAIGVKDSPKYSRFQRKVLGNSVDTIGRSVITIDPELDMDQVGIPEDMAWRMFRPFVIRRLVREGTPAAEAVKAVRDRTPAAKHHLDAEMKVRPVIYNRAPSLHRFNYVAGHARINKDSSISISQSVTKGMNADFDGDAINVHLPVSDKAVDEAKEKLLPSKNLLHPASFDVHLLPSQEYLAGLYLASQPDKARQTRVFATKEDVLKAYKRGEISVRDPVKILHP